VLWPARIGAASCSSDYSSTTPSFRFTTPTSYGPNFIGMQRRAAVDVDKILKAAKPGDLPIERPTRFDFVINLRTAAELVLTICYILRLDSGRWRMS
jgi:hypothetical protein